MLYSTTAIRTITIPPTIYLFKPVFIKYYIAQHSGKQKISLLMIGAVTGMSVNTVREHVCSLANKGLISAENTTGFTKTGLKHNGSPLYTIQPFRDALEKLGLLYQ